MQKIDTIHCFADLLLCNADGDATISNLVLILTSMSNVNEPNLLHAAQ